MSTHYNNYLHLKSTLKELPKTFYNKLTRSEKVIFDELLNSIDSTLSRPQPQKTHHKTAVIGDFQPRVVVFCLNLKKAILNRNYRLKRFAFGLVRCLFKEIQRTAMMREKKKAYTPGYQREVEFNGSSSRADESLFKIDESIMRVRAKTETKRKLVLNGVVKLMLKSREKTQRNNLLLVWKYATEKRIAKKNRFVQLISAVSRGICGRHFRNLSRRICSSMVPVELFEMCFRRMLNQRLCAVFYLMQGFLHSKPLTPEKILEVSPIRTVEFQIDKGESMCHFNTKRRAPPQKSGNSEPKKAMKVPLQIERGETLACLGVVKAVISEKVNPTVEFGEYLYCLGLAKPEPPEIVVPTLETGESISCTSVKQFENPEIVIPTLERGDFITCLGITKPVVQEKIIYTETLNTNNPQNELQTENGDFIPCLNYKEKALLESTINTKRNKGKVSAKPIEKEVIPEANIIEDENFEDFTRSGPKKTTKMIKKKKQLLGRSKDMEKINKVTSNHLWVLNFALLKWKKYYFSVQTSSQHREGLGITIVQLLEKALEKAKKNREYYAFENLKIQDTVKKQGKNFRLSVGISMISNFFAKKRVFSLFQGINSLKVPRTIKTYTNSSAGVSKVSKGAQSDIENLEKRTFYFYKSLKEVIKKIQLKKKIIGLVSIQNFYDSRIDRGIKVKLTSLFLVIQQIHFSALYSVFHEIKEKSLTFKIKSQAFYFIIQSLIENKSQKFKKSALKALEANSHGKLAYFVNKIEDTIHKSSMRSAFIDLNLYTVNLHHFKAMRDDFFGKLAEKIYTKRVSSSFLYDLFRKWGEFVECQDMEMELGLIPSLNGSVPRKFEFETGSHVHSLSQEIVNDTNYFMQSHSRCYSELIAK